MSTPLIVGNETFDYPVAGENPGWGEEATAWAVAVTNLLSTLQSSIDIVITTFGISDNVSSPTSINGLQFSTSTVRSATVQYSIFRTNIVESGLIFVNYNSFTSTWNLSRDYVGDAGMTFTITNAGQIQYTSTSTGFGGTMTFRAQALPQ